VSGKHQKPPEDWNLKKKLFFSLPFFYLGAENWFSEVRKFASGGARFAL
jgi:hypothetical protein